MLLPKKLKKLMKPWNYWWKWLKNVFVHMIWRLMIKLLWRYGIGSLKIMHWMGTDHFKLDLVEFAADNNFLFLEGCSSGMVASNTLCFHISVHSVALSATIQPRGPLILRQFPKEKLMRACKWWSLSSLPANHHWAEAVHSAKISQRQSTAKCNFKEKLV